LPHKDHFTLTKKTPSLVFKSATGVAVLISAGKGLRYPLLAPAHGRPVALR